MWSQCHIGDLNTTKLIGIQHYSSLLVVKSHMVIRSMVTDFTCQKYGTNTGTWTCIATVYATSKGKSCFRKFFTTYLYKKPIFQVRIIACWKANQPRHRNWLENKNSIKMPNAYSPIYPVRAMHNETIAGQDHQVPWLTVLNLICVPKIFSKLSFSRKKFYTTSSMQDLPQKC